MGHNKRRKNKKVNESFIKSLWMIHYSRHLFYLCWELESENPFCTITGDVYKNDQYSSGVKNK